MKKILVACCTLALMGSMTAVRADILIDNTTRNGSFETPDTGKIMFNTGTIPSWANWSEVDTADNDTGTDGASTPGTAVGLDGVRVAFLQPGGAIVNMTTYLIQEGDVIDYSFYNTEIGRAPATISLVWDNAGSMDQITGTGVEATDGTQGVGSYTVLAGDAWIGSTLGLGIVSGGSWPEVDQAYLEVVPEPATFGLVAVFGGAVLFIRRKLRI